MATNKSAASAEEQKPSTAVAKVTETGVPADVLALMEGYEDGAGTSASSDDNTIPYLVLLQDMSPEAKRRDPMYVEGAEPGYLLNKATKTLWGPDDECLVIPCHFERAVGQWKPRDQGGGGGAGYRGRHPVTGSIDETMIALGGKMVPDPKDPEARGKWVHKESGDDLIDTRYHYVMVYDAGSWVPAVIALSSTGHKASRDWMQLQRRPLPGSMRIPPAFFRKYRMTPYAAKNNKGDFFKLEFRDRGLIADRELVLHASRLYEAASSGKVTAAAEGEGTGGGQDGEKELPI